VVRFNFNMSDDLHALIKAESESTGVAMSALVYFAVRTYYEQRYTMDTMNKMSDLLSDDDKMISSKLDDINKIKQLIDKTNI
jgi:hypothetical protein